MLISKNYLRYNFLFLHVVRKSWNLYLNNEIFVGFSQACPGMPNTLQNNKAPISLGRVELFCLFVAYSYTSLEVTVLSYCFSWVWNKFPMSLERNKWFCWFFACNYLHVVRYPLKLQKHAIFGWHSQT